MKITTDKLRRLLLHTSDEWLEGQGASLKWAKQKAEDAHDERNRGI